MPNTPTTFTGVKPQAANPFADLPDLMKSILYHEENTQANIEIEEAHELTQAQGDAMMRVIRGIILKTFPPEQLVRVLEQELKISPDKATSVARDLLARRFVPMEWYIGPVLPLLEQLGGDVNAAVENAQRIFPEVYAPVDEEVTDEVPADFLPDDAYHLLTNFEDWITTPKGKAEILLRLTNLSLRAEGAMQNGNIPEAEAQKLLADLDSISYALNTQDLSSFEIHSMRRQIEKFLTAIEGRA